MKVVVELYRRAIEKGSIRAMNNLGVILEREWKPVEEIQPIERTAMTGDASAMYHLDGVIQNGQCIGDSEAVPTIVADVEEAGRLRKSTINESSDL
jgi:TPR repeat protein